MNKKQFKYYRIYFALVVGFLLTIAIYTIAKLWYYFNSGADRSIALNIPLGDAGDHIPYVRWLPDGKFEGLKISENIRELLLKDYLNGIYQKNISYLEGKPLGLKDYFTARAYKREINDILNQKNGPYFIKQADIDHVLQLRYFSADGQIASIFDQIRYKKQIIDKSTKKLKYVEDQTFDYKIVMLLEQDYWRIKSISREIPEKLYVFNDSLINNEGQIEVDKKKFILNGEEFFPKGINYYPKKSPWSMFGANYNPKIIENDFKIIEANGFNVVRIFINFHDFNKGRVSPVLLDQLNSVFDIAEKNNLKIILTFFDFLGDYSLFNYTSCDRQLETILGKFKNRNSLFAIDLKNEPDLDFHYQDENDVRLWLAFVLERAKKYAPNHLITIGWAFPENATNFAKDVDFVSFHSYRPVVDLQNDIQKLNKKIINKPILLEEYGLSDYRGIWSPFGKNAEDQKEYFEKVAKVLNENGKIPYVMWTLYDFEEVPNKVVGYLPWRTNPQKKFGLIDINQKPKPALEFFKKHNEEN